MLVAVSYCCELQPDDMPHTDTVRLAALFPGKSVGQMRLGGRLPLYTCRSLFCFGDLLGSLTRTSNVEFLLPDIFLHWLSDASHVSLATKSPALSCP
jgi:hypothetical protein